jgi:predicted RNA-binding protein associated with RNAse of E/G family
VAGDDGYDTQDLELDIVIDADGRVEVKDDDLLEVRVQEGRFTRAQADGVRAHGERIQLELAAGRRWWDPWWALWEPDPAWSRLTAHA